MGVSKNSGTPKSSILVGFSIINHQILGSPYFWKHPHSNLHAPSQQKSNKTQHQKYFLNDNIPPNTVLTKACFSQLCRLAMPQKIVVFRIVFSWSPIRHRRPPCPPVLNPGVGWISWPPVQWWSNWGFPVFLEFYQGSQKILSLLQIWKP